MTQFVSSVADDGSVVIRIVGEVDLANAAELVGCGRAALSETDAVEFDLSGLTFIDSTGLSTLLAIRREAHLREASVTLSHLTARTRDILRWTGLLAVFDIRDQPPSE